MNPFTQHFSTTKSQRIGFIIFLLFFIIFQIFLYFFPSRSQIKAEKNKALPPAVEKYLATSEPLVNSPITSIKYFNFNPNVLNKEGFKRLGFSEKQAQSIIKFRKKLGGAFTSAEEFSKCYVVSEEKFLALKPYIQLPKTTVKDKNTEKKISQYSPFDPNELSLNQWEELGFSKKQAQTIINYKNKVLKGHFSTPEELQKCFAVSQYKYHQLKPYIKIKKNNTNDAIRNTLYVNRINKFQWKKLGLNEVEAENILKFRDFNGGFHSKEDILKCTIVDTEKLKIITEQFILKFD